MITRQRLQIQVDGLLISLMPRIYEPAELADPSSFYRVAAVQPPSTIIEWPVT
jgi:hypothetical protein